MTPQAAFVCGVVVGAFGLAALVVGAVEWTFRKGER